jgi:phenylalanyl-tRNA synthetase alpha subunit
MDYVNGLKMYEAIVEQKILETSKSQIDKLTNMSDQLITVNYVPVPAEVKQIKEKTEEKIEEKKKDIEKQAIDIKNYEAKIEAEVPPVIQAYKFKPLI